MINAISASSTVAWNARPPFTRDSSFYIGCLMPMRTKNQLAGYDVL
jgi:hypothetical protein